MGPRAGRPVRSDRRRPGRPLVVPCCSTNMTPLPATSRLRPVRGTEPRPPTAARGRPGPSRQGHSRTVFPTRRRGVRADQRSPAGARIVGRQAVAPFSRVCRSLTLSHGTIRVRRVRADRYPAGAHQPRAPRRDPWTGPVRTDDDASSAAREARGGRRDGQRQRAAPCVRDDLCPCRERGRADRCRVAGAARDHRLAHRWLRRAGSSHARGGGGDARGGGHPPPRRS